MVVGVCVFVAVLGHEGAIVSLVVAVWFGGRVPSVSVRYDGRMSYFWAQGGGGGFVVMMWARPGMGGGVLTAGLAAF